jgi:hypothetical protein
VALLQEILRLPNCKDSESNVKGESNTQNWRKAPKERVFLTLHADTSGLIVIGNVHQEGNMTHNLPETRGRGADYEPYFPSE